MADETREARNYMSNVILANLDGWGEEYEHIQETLSMASSVNIIKLPSETVNETVADGSMYRYLIRYLREPQGV